MRLAADSSAVVRLYLDEDGADEIERFLVDNAKVISVSELARVEVLNVLLQDPDLGAAARFKADLDEGIRMRTEPVDWSDVFQKAESLANRFTPTLRPGGHDLVIVAAAVAMGATWFLSFDRNSRQRALATAAGLHVWPPLNKDEKGLVGHASQRVGG